MKTTRFRPVTAAAAVLLLAAVSFSSAARVAYIDIAQRREYVDHNILEPGMLMHGHVSLEDVSGEHTVALIWRDAHGRVAGADTVVVSPPVPGADFSISLSGALSYNNRIEATVDGEPQRAAREFSIRPRHKGWDDYYTAVWAHYEYEYLGTLRDAGINTHMIYKDFPYFEQIMDAGLHTYVDNICWRVFAPYHKWRHRWQSIKEQAARDPYNTSLLVRIPSFEDPATDEAMKTTIQQVVANHSPHRPIFFNLADEIGIGDQSGPLDFDHSIYARNAFVHYLRLKYLTVDKLNRQWDTDFDSFYEAARSTVTLTDAAMDRIWKKELPQAFGSAGEAAERFGVRLSGLADYVELYAALKSTPPRSEEQVERMMRRLSGRFGLEGMSARDLVVFAGEFHGWTTSLDVPNPSDWNLSPWMDHKDFMDRSLADAMGRARDYAREIYPEGVFGFTGGHSPGAFAGYNLEYLSRAADIQVPYNLACDVEIIRSLNKRTLLMSPTWADDERGIRTLWYQLFHGDRGVIFWDNDEERNKFIDKPTGELTARADNFAGALDELTSGIGKLILESQERRHDGIAVLYSHPSIRASWMIQHLGKGREWITRSSSDEYRELEFNQVRTSLLKLIEDHFYQYDYVSYTQLEQGVLDSGEYRLLFLPQSIALSDEQALSIERFVAAGGTVVADYRCGLMDESGRVRPEGGALDRVFGIRALEGAVEGINRVEPAGARRISLGGSRVLVNRFGDGGAVYLGRSLKPYYMQRLRPGEDRQLYDLFAGIFERAGIGRDYTVTRADGSRLPGTELVRYGNGGQELLAIFHNPQMRVLGIGGTREVDNSAFEKPENIRLRLPEGGHVYDLRAGRYLGRGSSFELTLDPWEPLLLSWSPQRVESITAGGPEQTDLGRCVTYDIELSCILPPSDRTKNIVGIRVTGPDGSTLHHYCDNIRFTGNSAEFTLPLAVNDPPGTYRISFTHINTGLSDSAELVAH